MSAQTASIIINNHNYGRFLREAIESALTQTYPQLEVIVVDDGSTDNSREVMSGYRERIVPLLKPNGGQASAFNAGFARCTGDIVFFLDSDDALLPSAVETVVSAWRDGLALVYFPLAEIDREGRPTGRLVGGNALPSVRIGPFAPGSPSSGNAFSRRALARAMPIPEAEWRMAADSYVIHACSLLGVIERLPIPLARYRRHGGNHSGRPPDLSEIRRAIIACMKFHESMSRVVPEGLPPLETWLGADPTHWLARIRSLRGGRAGHPYRDNMPELALKAIGAAWRHPYWNRRRKTAYTALVLACSVLPRRAGGALRTMEVHARDSLFRALLGRSRSHA